MEVPVRIITQPHLFYIHSCVYIILVLKHSKVRSNIVTHPYAESVINRKSVSVCVSVYVCVYKTLKEAEI